MVSIHRVPVYLYLIITHFHLLVFIFLFDGYARFLVGKSKNN